MEPSLVVIGVSYRTASLGVRERFCMDEEQRTAAVEYLVQREGIDEVIVFSTCNRTEFYVWSQDPPEASNSILRFLTRSYDLKLSEWSNFYRLVDENALIHILRVASSLDTHVFADADVLGYLKSEWRLAQRSGATGQFLDTIMELASEVAERVHSEARPATAIVPLACAAVQQMREIFSDLNKRNVLVLGSGELTEAVIADLKHAGVSHVGIAGTDAAAAKRIAREMSAEPLEFEDCAQEIFNADILISTMEFRQQILTAAGLDPLMRSRSDRPLVIIDLGVPRNVESAARGVPGIFLFDTDDLSESVHHRMPVRPGSAEAEQIIREEAANFLRRLQGDSALPAIAAVRKRLDDICETELDRLSEQYGPFTEDQHDAMRAFAAHITQRISATLARQLTQAQGHSRQDALAEAIGHLFQLPGGGASQQNH